MEKQRFCKEKKNEEEEGVQGMWEGSSTVFELWFFSLRVKEAGEVMEEQ